MVDIKSERLARDARERGGCVGEQGERGVVVKVSERQKGRKGEVAL